MAALPGKSGRGVNAYGYQKRYEDRGFHKCRIDVPELRGIFSKATDEYVTANNQVVRIRINPLLEICGNVRFYKADRETIELEDELFEKIKIKLGIGSSPEQDSVDRPLHTNERRTLLVVIEALCRNAKIKTDRPGAAKLIEALTEQIGAKVTENTIKTKIIDVISAAMESRAK